MAYPDGVSLAVVTAGNAFTASGGDAQVKVVMTPKFPKVGGGFLSRIVHAPSGWVMTSDSQVFNAPAGSSLSFTVPHVDQSGFRDPAQNAYTGWYYEVQVTVGGQSKTSYTQNAQPVLGQTLVDLDLVPDGPVGEAASASVPAVTSVNGYTGAVIVDSSGTFNVTEDPAVPGTAVI